ncbi:MAG: ABC transporter ATP-binding protein [Desulfomonile tiedjei]|nr:ABC transporter ATP-binding protein [Desulfomonile tiedjei]
MELLEIKGLSLHFGGIAALSDLKMSVKEGELHAVIGPNGAGKTSLFNCISGVYRPTLGEILLRGERISHLRPHEIAERGIARTFQNIELFSNMSVIDNLLLGCHTHMTSGPLSCAVFFGKAAKQEEEKRLHVEEIIDFLEIEKVRKKMVGTLPYGIQKRVEIGRALAMKPKVLLLDEPVAGMNIEETEDIARFILDIKEEKEVTVIMVEHDMGVVMDIADTVTVLDFGSKIGEGTPSQVQSNPDVIAAYLGA